MARDMDLDIYTERRDMFMTRDKVKDRIMDSEWIGDRSRNIDMDGWRTRIGIRAGKGTWTVTWNRPRQRQGHE